MDYILDGQANGDVASRLMQHNCDAGVLRPYIGPDGRSYVTVNQGGKPVSLLTNANATLRKDEWIMLDTAVIKAAKERLKVTADLRAKGLQLNIPNGMAKTVHQHQTQSDISGALVSMDGLTEGERDRPQYDLRNLPLPITHKDFSFSLREVLASRNGGSPVDTTTAELAGRRVAESIEQTVLGVSNIYAYGGGTIYGYANYPYRLTKSLTAPTGSNADVTVNEVLAMIQQAVNNNYYGPFMLYHSRNWGQYMDGDYDTSNRNDTTLRSRLLKIQDITAVEPADYLTGTTLLLVQMTSDVVRLINGMEITTVQWETMGGMQLNFKVMAIQVPQIRSDYSHQCGIVHGSV